MEKKKPLAPEAGPASRLALTRRSFLLWSAALGASGALPSAAAVGRPRLGFVGLGVRGFAVLGSTLALGERTEVVALCDREPEALRQAGRICVGCKPHIGTRPEALFANREVDAVVLAVPAVSQLSLAGEACKAGKDVLLLRPLPFAAAPLRELAAIANANGRRVEICRQRIANLGPTSAAALVSDATGEPEVDAVIVESRLTLPAPLPIEDLLSQLVDEVELGFTLLGPTELERRFELGGTSPQRNVLADYQLHFESRGLEHRRSLTIKILARSGEDGGSSRILLAGRRGRAESLFQANPVGASQDLELFTGSAAGAGFDPGTYARIVDLLSTTSV
jgi:hypothetical protein